jgi:YhcH/YjgK/YiaL family protein
MRWVYSGNFTIGKTVIIPNEVLASATRKPGHPAIAAGFEYHAQFADLHLCLRGQERIGWRRNADGLTIRSVFNDDEDFGLYDGTPDEFVPVYDGRFAIFFPGELHSPLIAEGEVTKVCIKIRYDSSERTLNLPKRTGNTS